MDVNEIPLPFKLFVSLTNSEAIKIFTQKIFLIDYSKLKAHSFSISHSYCKRRKSLTVYSLWKALLSTFQKCIKISLSFFKHNFYTLFAFFRDANFLFGGPLLHTHERPTSCGPPITAFHLTRK